MGVAWDLAEALDIQRTMVVGLFHLFRGRIQPTARCGGKSIVTFPALVNAEPIEIIQNDFLICVFILKDLATMGTPATFNFYGL